MTELPDGFERLRELKRARHGRIAFDCFNLKEVDTVERRVQCSKGHKFAQSDDGTMAEVSALRGLTPAVCKNCPDFTCENGEDIHNEREIRSSNEEE
jgi:hypothetical protein